jgi:pyroglutamyl-peptidase
VIQRPSILFTGFEPFGGDIMNPSWLVAESAAQVCGSPAVLLPVTFEAVRAFAESRAATVAVISIGLRSNSPAVAVETIGACFAADVPDNDGASPAGSLVAGGPVSLAVGSLAASIVSELRTDCAYEVERSCDAGAYVCNALLYHLLRTRGAGGPLGSFVHVPRIDESEARALGAQLGTAVARVLRPK